MVVQGIEMPIIGLASQLIIDLDQFVDNFSSFRLHIVVCISYIFFILF